MNVIYVWPTLKVSTAKQIKRCSLNLQEMNEAAKLVDNLSTYTLTIHDKQTTTEVVIPKSEVIKLVEKLMKK